jgi:hypothetical protein
MTPHIFKPGDQAFHPAHGVVRIDKSASPTYCLFDGMRTYTQEGRNSTDDKFPTLLTLEEARIKYPERMPKEPRSGYVARHYSCGCFNGPCTERAKHDCVEMREVL